MNYIKDLSDIYTSLLTEDYASSVAEASKILKNNQVENSERIIRDLEEIIQNVEIEDPEHANSKKDFDIIMLVYMILANKNYTQINDFYKKYRNAKSAYDSDIISGSINELKAKIQNQKLFKPSPQKTQLITMEINQIVSRVHNLYYSETKGFSRDVNLETNGDKVYEDDNIAVLVADSKQKCINYGDDKLCISQPPGSKHLNFYWAYRTGSQTGYGMTTYFVFWKDKSNKILVDALGNDDQPMNEYSWNSIEKNIDQRISKEELIQKFPVLKPAFDADVFKYIPYGENEKRFYEIEEFVKSILDDRLQTAEDYDMFIESGKPVSEQEWNALNPRFAKSIFKKYVGMANNNIPFTILDKFLNKGTDIKWFEDDVAPRNIGLSIEYYLYRNGNFSINENFNKNILNIVKSEIIKAENVKQKLISRAYGDDNRNLFDIRITDDLYILPDLSEYTARSFDCRNTKITSLQGAPAKVEDGFNCYGTPITSLQGAPTQVGGHFDCGSTQITTLEGAPKQVGGSFYCTNTKITSLQGAPEKIGGSFNCSNTQITSLQGAPKQVGLTFSCSSTKITSLKGAPKQVRGDFDCSYNQHLTSLQGAPEKIGGSFTCRNTPITSLQGAPTQVGGNFYCGSTQITTLEGAPESHNADMLEWGREYGKSLKKEIQASFNEDPITESKSYNLTTFNMLLQYMAEINEAVEVGQISNVNIQNISKDMENLEDKYFPYWASQDFEDIENDISQPGFIGCGIFDNDKIKGYIYGYAVSNDEYDDIKYIDFSKLHFYNEQLKSKLLHNEDYENNFKKTFAKTNTHYVSNLIVDTPYRRYTYNLIKDFLKNLRSNGYKYIIFDALSDTVNLFIDPNGDIKKDRLAKAGLQPLVTFNTDYSKLSIFAIQ